MSYSESQSQSVALGAKDDIDIIGWGREISCSIRTIDRGGSRPAVFGNAAKDASQTGAGDLVLPIIDWLPMCNTTEDRRALKDLL